MALAKESPKNSPPQTWWTSIEALEDPFWKKKEKVYKKIKREREIIVSVKVIEPTEAKKPKNLKMIGAGHTNVERKKLFEFSKDFSHLTKMSPMIKEAKFNPKTNILYMHTEAFKYHARMWMKIYFDDAYKGSTSRSAQRFEIVKGTFQGLKGVILFEDYGRRKAEISLTADYYFHKLPIPQFFVKFGLEVAIQKMSARMRSYSEDHFRKQEKEENAKSG